MFSSEICNTAELIGILIRKNQGVHYPEQTEAFTARKVVVFEGILVRIFSNSNLITPSYFLRNACH